MAKAFEYEPFARAVRDAGLPIATRGSITPQAIWALHHGMAWPMMGEIWSAAVGHGGPMCHQSLTARLQLQVMPVKISAPTGA
jgi:hypothetical protein